MVFSYKVTSLYSLSYEFMYFLLCSWNCIGKCPYPNLTKKVAGFPKPLHISNYTASLSIRYLLRSCQVLAWTSPVHGIQQSKKLLTTGSELMFLKQKLRLAIAGAHIAGIVEYQHEERLV